MFYRLANRREARDAAIADLRTLRLLRAAEASVLCKEGFDAYRKLDDALLRLTK